MSEPDETLAPGPAQVRTEHLAALRASIDPQQVGPYRIIERLGEGGMGAVYKAEQRHPIRRTVAVKLIKAGCDTREVIARFDSERQALARMDHPHIAKVLDAGAGDTGQPYFVMEYVPGIAITKFADDNKLSVRQRLELFVQVCDAIGHAHTKAIIHRDIKASNVLALAQDGKPTVKVIDFGIAKAVTSDRLTDQTFATERGMPIGTYDSMSPEQADGSPDVDTRTDVYSLGVLLYELLSGAKPFDRDTLAKAADQEIRRIIREVEPPRPSARLTGTPPELATKVASARQTRPDELARQLRGELEWIPLKAMRKERDRRYASPQQLAEDIDNYLAGRPLLAGPESAGYRVRKFVRRHRAPLLAAGAVAAALVIGVAAATWGWLDATRARQLAVVAQQLATDEAKRADEQRDRADARTAEIAAERQRLTEELLRSDLLRGKLLLQSGSVPEAEKLLWKVFLASDPKQDPRARWALWKLYYDQPKTSLPWRLSDSFDVSKDGRWLALVEGSAVKLIDLDTNRLHATYRAGGRTFTDVAVSPSGASLAAGSDDEGPILVWCRTDPSRPPTALRFEPEVSDRARPPVSSTPAPSLTTRPWELPPTSSVFFVDEMRLLIVTQRFTRSEFQTEWAIWDVNSARLIWKRTAAGFSVTEILAATAESCTVVGGGRTVLRIPFTQVALEQDAEFSAIMIDKTGDLRWSVPKPSAAHVAVRALLRTAQRLYYTIPVTATRDGKYLLVGRDTAEGLTLLDLRTLERIRNRPDIPADATARMTISHDGTCAARTSSKGTVLLTIPELDERKRLAGLKSPGRLLSFTGDDRALIASDPEGSIARYELGLTEPIEEIRAGSPSFATGRLGAKGPLITWGFPLRTEMWTAGASHQFNRDLSELMSSVHATAITDDGTMAAFLFQRQPVSWVSIYDLSTGSRIAAIAFENARNDQVFCPTFSRDNQVIAVSVGGDIILLNARTQQPDRILRISEDRVNLVPLTFSPDGKRIACIENRSILVLVDIENPQRQVRAALKAPDAPRLSVEFAPDGGSLAVTANDQIDLYDPTDLRPAGSLAVAAGQITAIGHSPDGSMLAVGNIDGTLRLWDLRRREELLSLPLNDGAFDQLCFSTDGNRIRYIAARRAAELNLRAFDHFIDANRDHFEGQLMNSQLK